MGQEGKRDLLVLPAKKVRSEFKDLQDTQVLLEKRVIRVYLDVLAYQVIKEIG